MAESILKLKIDSGEYEGKIKRATQGLLQMERECHNMGGVLKYLDKEQKDFVSALGNMQTVAQDSRGKLGELTKAYTELRLQYNRLTEEEKKGDYGTALSQSLDQLKNRIRETKSELNGVTNELNGGFSQAIDNLGGKFGLNIKQLAGWGAAFGAVKTAMDVAKDAFFNNEEQLDEWGRVVESSKSLYAGFLNALNSGDISGYISNIDNIVKAARNAYDALDELGTFNAFNQINFEKARTNMTKAVVDYREGSGTKEAVKAAAEAYKKELKERQRRELKAYQDAVADMAAKRGVSAKDLQDALSGTYEHYQEKKNVQPTGERVVNYGNSLLGGGGSYIEKFAQNDEERLGAALQSLNDTELQSLQALGAQAERTGNEIAGVDRQLARLLNSRQNQGGGGGSTGGGKVEAPAVEGSIDAQAKKVQELQKAWRAAADDDSRRRIKEEIDLAQYALDRMQGKNVFDATRLAGDVKGASIATPTLTDPFSRAAANGNELRQQMVLEVQADTSKVDTATLETLMKDSIRNGIDDALLNMQMGTMAERIKLGVDVSDEQWQGIIEQYNKLREQIGLNPISIDLTTGKEGKDPKELEQDGKKAAKSWSTAAQAVSSVGQAFSSLKDPAAKIAATVAQAIASVALAYAQTLAEDKTTKGNIWAFIAASAAAMVSMATTISTIHSTTGYARGGVVEGTHYSGDMEFARLNAGETVLTQAQAGNVASALQDSANNFVFETELRGDRLRLLLRRDNMKRGYGTKRLML